MLNTACNYTAHSRLCRQQTMHIADYEKTDYEHDRLLKYLTMHTQRMYRSDYV